MLRDVEYRPDWWDLARCRGDGPEQWTVTKAGPNCSRTLAELRAVCAGCPVSGRCLADAMDLPKAWLLIGPVRLGLSGPKGWRRAFTLVAAFDPVTNDDFDTLAAMLLDDRAAVTTFAGG